MNRTAYHVEKMDCAAEERLVRMALADVPGVAVDTEDNVYLLTRDPANPLLVFDANGAFLRGFGQVLTVFKIYLAKRCKGDMRQSRSLSSTGLLAGIASRLRVNVHAPGHQGQCGYGCD